MRAEVRSAIGESMGSPVTRADPVSGGDINQAFRVDLADGRRVFVKTNPSADPEMFPAEAQGLDWLRQAAAVAVPEVLAVSGHQGARFLVLEWLESGRPRASFDEELGRGLAALHRAGAPVFGLERDNFIGRLPQSNAHQSSWAAFLAEERLLPMARLASHWLGRDTSSAIERLCTRLDTLMPAEAPARLHGDLWGGNLHVTATGAPCLIDPAVYGGHREMDLGMMRLFGGFSERVFDAYHEAFPLQPGQRERVELCQLYPLLVHVNLFGESYVSAVRRALARYE
jgi:protein-ribulosamine 3-kinase